MKTRAYSCNRWKFLKIGKSIAFKEGRFETADEELQKLIERSDYFGVYIHWVEDPKIAAERERQEAEAKRLAELEEKHRREAQEKAKAEKETKEKAEAEAKKKADADAKAKADADVKAKAEADLKAEKQKKAS
jgi:membrane protein involved in colicin uptake